jgi:pimeloyl-ACP methyl ester carboxylesterase
MADFEAAGYHCIRIINPNTNRVVDAPTGVDFDVMADAIAAIIARPDVADGKVHVVAHDWGAVFAYTLGMLLERAYEVCCHTVAIKLPENEDVLKEAESISCGTCAL